MIDTVILHTAEAEAEARALASVWPNRAPVRVLADGGAPISVGGQLLLVGVLGRQGLHEAEAQMLSVLCDESRAAVLLMAPGRPTPQGAAESKLPVFVSTGDALADAQMIDEELRTLGRSVVFGGAARAVFGRVGRPRAPKVELPARARVETETAEMREPEVDPQVMKKRHSLGVFVGIGLGLVAAAALLAPWAIDVLRSGVVE